MPSQSWHYAFGLAATGIDPKLAVVRSGDSVMKMVYYERDWQGNTDVATVPGLAGALLIGEPAAPLSLGHEYAKDRKWIACYLQIAPYADPPLNRMSGEVVAHKAVFLLYLSMDGNLQIVSRMIQRQIRLGISSGAALVEDREKLAESLIQLYPQTMQQLGAEPPPQLLALTVERWRGDPWSMLLGAEKDGNIVAVYLFLRAGAFAESHMLAYKPSGRGLIAWLVWHGARRLREAGVSTLNLGGGLRVRDGIFHFKERFNGARRDLRSVRQIYNLEQYQRLCSQAGVSSDSTERLPAYRRRGGSP